VSDGEGSVGSARWDGWLGPRQWIPIAGVLVIAIAVLGVLLALNLGGDSKAASQAHSTSNDGRQDIHVHADFALFIRGQQFDFGQKKFISVEGEELSETVHIHDPRHTLVHVHKEGVTWDEFFTSLGFKLDDPSFKAISPDKTCMTLPGGEKLCQGATETFKFFVNGVKVDGVSSTGIYDLDRVLISFGPESVAEVAAKQLPRVSDEACIPSERCGDRIPKDQTPEPCSVSTGCIKPGG
jgi:hypothetical protein